MPQDNPSSPTPRDAALAIVQILQDQGHIAYFAGGCVRDALLGMTPKDYDVATSALPDQVAAIFRNTQFVGEAFGVTLVRIKKQAVEVATFRKESGYNDGRHPTKVEFTDAQTDAHRRDFTVNGLFENPHANTPDQTIIDFVNGQADLTSKTLRAIGNPDERFADDYLRMLRAARFAAKLNFNIEEKTARAITINARYLGQISRERIGQEIMAMLTPAVAPSPHAIVKAASLVQSLRLDGPALNSSHMLAPLPTLTQLSEQLSEQLNEQRNEQRNELRGVADDNPNNTSAIDYPACLLAWLIDRRHAAASASHATSTHDTFVYQNWLLDWIARDASKDLSRLRKSLILSNAVHDAMKDTTALIAKAPTWSDISIAQRKRLLANPYWDRTHAMLTAMSHQPWIQAVLQPINADVPALIASGIAPQILLTGDDLIQLGQKPGPSFRRLLDQAYDLQLEGKLTTRNGALAWIKDYLKA